MFLLNCFFCSAFVSLKNFKCSPAMQHGSETYLFIGPHIIMRAHLSACTHLTSRISQGQLVRGVVHGCVAIFVSYNSR